MSVVPNECILNPKNPDFAHSIIGVLEEFHFDYRLAT